MCDLPDWVQDVLNEYDAAMCASNEAGYVGVTAEQTIRYLMERTKAAEDAVNMTVALQQKLDAMAAENAALKSSIPKLKHVDLDNDNMDDVSLAEDIGFNDAVTLMNRWKGETPVTDTYRNSVRAEGVDKLADFAGQQYQLHEGDKVQQKKWKSVVFLCCQYAEQLRSGTHDTADKAG